MKLRDVPADMIAKADAVGHQTVWLKDNEKAFVFISWDAETAKKAKAALEAAGVLCDTTAGYVPQDDHISELDLAKFFSRQVCFRLAEMEKDCGESENSDKLTIRGGDGSEDTRTPTKLGHRAYGFNHKEAFCLMKYQSGDSLVVEWIWNSRDGVTPFIVKHGSEELEHVDFLSDRCVPDHLPKVGDRIFIDLTPESYREKWAANMERQKDEFAEHQAFQGKTDDEILDVLTGDWRAGMPSLVTVTPEILGRLEIADRSEHSP